MSHSARRSGRLAAAAASALGLLGVLGGCSNMSGLGGSAQMSCPAPPGVPCMSVSGVHANASAGTLPSQRGAAGPSPADLTPDPTSRAAQASGQLVARLTPLVAASEDPPALGAIRSEPTLIRIWIAPWEDSDGDLHSDSYVYLQVDSGRWLIEHNRERVRRQFAPMPASATAPMPVPATAAAGAASPAKAAQQAATPPRAAGMSSQGATR